MRWWSRVSWRPVLVHNALLFGAVILSAAGMVVLVERLTGSRAAAVIGGIIFAFAPYRFDHYMHMELQWTVWLPWALWAVHRTLESGRLVHGLQAGLFVALQMLSSVYLRTAVPRGESAGGTAPDSRDQQIQRAAARLPGCYTGQQDLRRRVRQPS